MSIENPGTDEVTSDELRERLSLSTRVTTPELYCPFAPLVHPCAALVDERSIAWAWSVGLIDESRAERLRGSRVGWLVSRAFPEARVYALQLAADWTLLFCLLDDKTEKIDDPAELKIYLDDLLDVFCGKAHPAEGDEIGRAFEDLGRRTREETPEAWQHRFLARIEELFRAFGAEAEGRAKQVIPAIVDYLKIREVTVGLYVEFELGALTNGIVVPESVHQDPSFRRLVRHACNIVGWANDIYTYKKEILQGEVHNLVMVTMNERGISLDEAVDWAVVFHDAETRAFESLLASMPSFGAEIDAQVAAYAGMLTSWVRGHLDWAHETGRYVTADGNPPSSKRWQSFMAAQFHAGLTTPPDLSVAPSSLRMSLATLAEALGSPDSTSEPETRRLPPFVTIGTDEDDPHDR